VAAIGASVGGLDAILQLLQQVPGDLGMALVVIQHLNPEHTSHLPELLARVSAMPVATATHNQRLEANRVYVISPNARLTLAQGRLKLAAREPAGPVFHPIDEFFESLARERAHQAIGIILSGTGTDGTLGLKTIKAEGGLTFAQDEQTAKFDGMPHSAIASGAVDFVLPPDEIGRRLAQLSGRPYVAVPDLAAAPAAQPDDAAARQQIIGLLRIKTGVDFAAYKHATFERRLQRRMTLTGYDRLTAYAAALEGQPEELDRLYDDLFIHVTRFFRDPDLYKTLKRKVFPELARRAAAGTAVRIWVPGCSTGEEAYSVVMAWREFADKLAKPIPLQVFGTDISRAAIDQARTGRYTDVITADVSPDRLRRFFVEAPGGYQVAKSVREACVFAPHNLLADPPFTQLDLICCRNVLIYLEATSQHRLARLFHYGLRATGYLVLGPSEDIGSFSDLFAALDKKQRVYAKKPGSRQPLTGLLPWRPPEHRTEGAPPPAAGPTAEPLEAQVIWTAGDRIALTHYAPPSVIVDGVLNVVQFRGRLGAYLEPAPGAPSRNLLKMAPEGLQLALTGLLRKAQTSTKPVRQEGVKLEADGQVRRVTLEAIPFQVPGLPSERYFLVTFAEAAPVEATPLKAANRSRSSARQKLSDRETADLRETLQAVIAERDATHEALTAALEELQSANEQLQSTNEELQTVREELQSANEELMTLNEELENQNRELSLALGNLSNVVDSVRLPIVIVGANLRIRLYNPAAEQVLSLVGTDVGRPIGAVKSLLNVGELEPLIRTAIKTLTPYDQEVQDRTGRWYAMRIRPYQSLENTIDGAILTWSDITALKGSLTSMTEAHDYLAAVMATIQSPVLVLDPSLRIRTANEAFLEIFQVSRAETEGELIYRLGNGQWDIPELRRLLEEILPAHTHFFGLEVTHDFPRIGEHTLLLNARQVLPEQGEGALILLAFEDITPLKRVAEMDQVRQWAGRLEVVREEERTRLSRDVHDQLGSELTALKMQLYQLRHGLTPDQAPQDELVQTMADSIDGLVDFVRRIASNLRPLLLDDLGLLAAMEWQLAEFRHQTGLRARIQSSATDLVVPPETLTTAFRIFQEALTNVARHAQATEVQVTLEARQGALQLQVRDNGLGIAPAALAGQGSLGLMGMRERALQVGGQLDISGSPGQGTMVRLRLPLPRALDGK
jgi:two-component system CheB/CheR fusion protein